MGIIYSRRRNLEIKLSKEGYFQGIVSAKKLKNPWPREETADLKEKIEAPARDIKGKACNRPIIVVGSSGAGKSVLLRGLDASLDNNLWRVKYIETYKAVNSFDNAADFFSCCQFMGCPP